MTRLYRKRPLVVEARQVNADDWDGVLDIANWSGADIVDVEQFLAHSDKAVMAVRTLEGVMYADDGDWIVRGVLGEFYPCKPDAFQATYEPLNPNV